MEKRSSDADMRLLNIVWRASSIWLSDNLRPPMARICLHIVVFPDNEFPNIVDSRQQRSSETGRSLRTEPGNAAEIC